MSQAGSGCDWAMLSTMILTGNGVMSAKGAAASDTAKLRPIEPPMIAIALARCSSRVRSAAKAVTGAEIAPAPCIARPRMTHWMSDAHAATKLPSAKSSKPITITRFLP